MEGLPVSLWNTFFPARSSLQGMWTKAVTPQADVLMGYVTGEARGQGHPFRDEESSIFQYCHKVPPCELEILSDLCLLTLASCSGNCVFTFATMNNELVCFLWKLEGLACRSLSLNTFFFLSHARDITGLRFLLCAFKLSTTIIFKLLLCELNNLHTHTHTHTHAAYHIKTHVALGVVIHNCESKHLGGRRTERKEERSTNFHPNSAQMKTILSLVYRVSSRTARATEKPCLEKP
ncbi:mCG147408, partial [Mus musculus]